MMTNNAAPNARRNPSRVTEVPTAPAEAVLQHFQARLSFETDCWDVNHAIRNAAQDFVLIDVRAPELYAQGHVPSAINIPVGRLVAAKLVDFAADSVFVVYCAGPHCNGADRAALQLARLGRPVKIMIGGVTGWRDEGFALVREG